MRVVITADCAGTGQCAAVAPDVFELDSEGLSTVSIEPASKERRDAARKAAELCPMAAIQIED